MDASLASMTEAIRLSACSTTASSSEKSAAKGAVASEVRKVLYVERAFSFEMFSKSTNYIL
jgi:hypothetical protein